MAGFEPGGPHTCDFARNCLVALRRAWTPCLATRGAWQHLLAHSTPSGVRPHFEMRAHLLNKRWCFRVAFILSYCEQG